MECPQLFNRLLLHFLPQIFYPQNCLRRFFLRIYTIQSQFMAFTVKNAKAPGNLPGVPALMYILTKGIRFTNLIKLD